MDVHIIFTSVWGLILTGMQLLLIGIFWKNDKAIRAARKAAAAKDAEAGNNGDDAYAGGAENSGKNNNNTLINMEKKGSGSDSLFLYDRSVDMNSINARSSDSESDLSSQCDFSLSVVSLPVTGAEHNQVSRQR